MRHNTLDAFACGQIVTKWADCSYTLVPAVCVSCMHSNVVFTQPFAPPFSTLSCHLASCWVAVCYTLVGVAYLSYLVSSAVILQLAMPTLLALKCETTWAAVWRSDTTKQLPCNQMSAVKSRQTPLHPASTFAASIALHQMKPGTHLVPGSCVTAMSH